MSIKFDHEKLHVYQESLKFIEWLQGIMERIPKGMAVYGHLDCASTSIPTNIAEGNGKFTEKDRCKYFDIARGSALECASALDILVAKTIFSREEAEEGKYILQNIVSMLVGLIKSNSRDRIYEDTKGYGRDLNNKSDEIKDD